MSGQHIRAYTGKPVRRYLGFFTVAAYDRMCNTIKARHPELTQDQIRITMNEVIKGETKRYMADVQRLIAMADRGDSR